MNIDKGSIDSDKGDSDSDKGSFDSEKGDSDSDKVSSGSDKGDSDSDKGDSHNTIPTPPWHRALAPCTGTPPFGPYLVVRKLETLS